ncbi:MULTISPECIES: hypothetical protein [Burkholderia cepacia complex]|nr:MULTISPECIES: hypothetical protein [Burkholderia cepacia complex]MBU9210861.1 hypothetical protein [Burkholderia multivorans]MBU9444565.1 hypothetical protein [Burkholderia multivorans]MBU9546162.1 hypothetical protein [Burkholderia multivorans]MBY4755668.1 hypothetical protein [Burkholderia dolosa]MDC6086669.1 hypothetical protein [Burkholderia cenocepacia]
MTAYTYEDACDMTVTRAEAEAEIGRHDVAGGFSAFLAEVGDRPEYEGKEVLDWLGC